MVISALNYFPKLESLNEETEHSNDWNDKKSLAIFQRELCCEISEHCFEELHESEDVCLLFHLLKVDLYLVSDF